ncbi:malate synthase A [Glycomyces sp. L485]|uniref:malate synthase A n=1 Tax=Glycomyces sp. L485 TaxID=2909235 RepID=UPI001F4B72BB|nr:malate synthase A [Glycomyces sp. L485]MCH7230261.1 malate synthase A [Glycomyces sp. L485]
MGILTETRTAEAVTVTGPAIERQDEILTPEALDFLAELHHAFVGRRQELLQRRQQLRTQIANGLDPRFLPETTDIRDDISWSVATLAPGLEDRRVEITGPCERKMTINALNSGAKCWLADMEDSSTPSWSNVVNSQINLIDAIEHRIDFTTEKGKSYRLNGAALTDLPTIIVRPRGWHLAERHLRVDGVPMSGSLVDFGLYFFHNAERLLELGRGPYFYLPKLESHLEARLWNDVFVLAQEMLGIPRGTIRATVLIETITAAFEMEEILYELREHSSGLNAGRWDYIFSVIKNFRERGGRFVLPDRELVSMTQPFMRAYTELLVRTCHRRSASAIGGMAAFIPNRRDPEANATAMAKVRADKAREADDGFDGSWVAHPDLVPVAMEVFDEALGGIPNQIDRLREDVVPDERALLDVAATEGDITERGIRANIDVGIRYVESWLRGNGAAAINNLMEDAATAEISRSQIWQWIHCEAVTDTKRVITREWVAELVREEFAAMERFEGDRFDDALAIFAECALGEDYPTFLTLPAYARFLC